MSSFAMGVLKHVSRVCFKTIYKRKMDGYSNYAHHCLERYSSEVIAAGKSFSVKERHTTCVQEQVCWQNLRASDLPTTPFHQLRPVGLKPRPRVVDHAHNTEVLTMSCFGSVLSYLFGRDETVNGHNYKVIRRVGEGGK